RAGKAVGSGALRYTASGIWTTAHDVHTLSWWAEKNKDAGN
ncbi:MAG: YncE family protein, partial [Planctomycetes bacterium]|nr:YncE family protein [Planctomycetota bacterium]